MRAAGRVRRRRGSWELPADPGDHRGLVGVHPVAVLAHAAVDIIEFGDNLLVLTSFRHPPFSLGALTCLGIEPEKRAFLVVKAAIAYRAAYGPIAGSIIEVGTPGLTAVDPFAFPYRHRPHPLWPLDPAV
ncbi:MAG: MlrC C-terminal domain-containing protein [Gemmataceae bacterium]